MFLRFTSIYSHVEFQCTRKLLTADFHFFMVWEENLKSRGNQLFYRDD